MKKKCENLKRGFSINIYLQTSASMQPRTVHKRLAALLLLGRLASADLGSSFILGSDKPCGLAGGLVPAVHYIFVHKTFTTLFDNWPRFVGTKRKIVRWRFAIGENFCRAAQAKQVRVHRGCATADVRATGASTP